MDRRVSWTDVALSDLESIADFIAQDSRYYAAALVREIRDAARSLKHFAERGRLVPEFDSPILALIHGARNLNALPRKSTKG